MEPSKIDGLETTMMAIREYLMTYYKGTCIESIVGENNVRLRQEHIGTRELRAYQRNLSAQKNLKRLTIGDTTIATLQEVPCILTLHNTTLYRSPELREIRLKTLKFMGQYLRGVRIIEKGSKRMGERDDSGLIAQPEIPTEMFREMVYGNQVYNVAPTQDSEHDRIEREHQNIEWRPASGLRTNALDIENFFNTITTTRDLPF
jgi:hypothetical protein